MSSLASSTPVPSKAPTSESPSEGVISPPQPLYVQALHFASIWTFRSVINTAEYVHRQLKPSPPSQLKPLIKSYPIRPTLENRIFIPPSISSSSDKSLKYPVYFSVHGGGWTANSPVLDDEFCSLFCQKHDIIVISLDYRKAPSFRFPVPVMDIASLIPAILADLSLHIDVDQVALGGFSAGSNLAFAACQVKELKGKIKGLVGLYPVLDSSESREEKIARKPKGKDVPIDGVGWTAEFLDWGYVPQGQDRRDPLLSPRYAEKNVMPKHVFLLGAEWDMLCYEAEATADNLAVEGEERRSVNGEGWYGWVQGLVRWEIFPQRTHAFTHIHEWTKGKEEVRRKLVDELYERMGKWLKEEVWNDLD